MAGLTDKQDQFCKEYLIDLNATQAAIRAGYSQNAAKEQASRLLTKANVQERISSLKAQRDQRTNVTMDRVINELAKIAFVNPKDLYDYKGTLNSVSDLDDNDAAAISEITHNTTAKETKYKLHSKTTALDMLMKHVGGYSADNKQKESAITIVTDPDMSDRLSKLGDKFES